MMMRSAGEWLRERRVRAELIPHLAKRIPFTTGSVRRSQGIPENAAGLRSNRSLSEQDRRTSGDAGFYAQGNSNRIRSLGQGLSSASMAERWM